MRKLGCVLINIGLESGSNRLLKLMRKGYTVEDAELMLQNMQKSGMNVHLYCICAFPTETEEESKETLSFLRTHIFKSQSVYFQDYEAQLASSVFSGQLGTDTLGYKAATMIEKLLADKEIARHYVSHGNLVRRKGYPFIEDHNFLYLANENK
jgi:tRNA A37 methylthiotransferase MiaB